MPASGIKLPDANIWLAVAVDGHSHHAAAESWFNAQPEQTCALCRVTQMALLRHLTNSKIMGENVQSQAKAWRAYEVLLRDSRVVFLSEPAALESAFRSLSESDSPSHERWTDAYLAAFAARIPAQLVTFDKGFSRFAGLDLHLLA
jgi:toxin-antitoxin system PIN domain toxin